MGVNIQAKIKSVKKVADNLFFVVTSRRIDRCTAWDSKLWGMYPDLLEYDVIVNYNNVYILQAAKLNNKECSIDIKDDLAVGNVLSYKN